MLGHRDCWDLGNDARFPEEPEQQPGAGKVLIVDAAVATETATGVAMIGEGRQHSLVEGFYLQVLGLHPQAKMRAGAEARPNRQASVAGLLQPQRKIVHERAGRTGTKSLQRAWGLEKSLDHDVLLGMWAGIIPSLIGGHPNYLESSNSNEKREMPGLLQMAT
jgi:hypothetical protein